MVHRPGLQFRKLFPSRAILFALAICLCGSLSAGIKETGLPFINNFSRTEYQAANQNWSVTQNSKGFVYFGNNDGLLEFDGNNWRLYPNPNPSILRAVMAVGDTIFTGAFEEFGYYAEGGDGALQYHSLVHLIPQSYRAFDEIWRIHRTDQGILFQSFRHVFIYQDDRIRIIDPPSDFGLSYQAQGQVYLVDREAGLMRLSDNTLELLSSDPVILHNEVRCILGYENNRLILGTGNEGLYLFDGQSLTPWNIPLNDYLKKHSLFSAIRLANGYYVFGTVQNGIYIANEQGAIVQHLNRLKGLQNNTILGLFEDRRNNLWLGLDNGIDYAELGSPLSILDFNFSLESTYASLLFEGNLYAGTNQGLYVVDWDRLGATDAPYKSFELVPGTEGQVWNLQEINGELFCAHNFGLFLVEGKTARKISGQTGFWCILPLSGQQDTLLAGTYTGLTWLRKQQGRWVDMGEMGGFSESSRMILPEEDGGIWIAHGYKGLFRVTLSEDLQRVESVKLFGPAEGLPAELPYNIHRVQGEMLVTTPKGIFGFRPATQAFEIHDRFEEIFRGLDFLDKIHEDQAGNLWVFTTTSMGVYRRLEDGTFNGIFSPFHRINSMLLPAFENILILDNQHVFIGSMNGLIHYDATLVRDLQQPDPVFIREVVFHGRETRHIYNPGPEHGMETVTSREIPYSMNSVQFRFALPGFTEQGSFSYRLRGFEDNWSGWESGHFKEYTNLREGSYVFELKGRNAYRAESPVVTFSFTVRPPLLRSRAAYAVYSLLVVLAVAGNGIYWRRRLRKTRVRDRYRHQLRLEQQQSAFREESLKSEKEIIHLRNESLRNAMDHKTRELANATMNLIQKNKMLTSIRDKLLLLARAEENPEHRFQVGQLIKKINKDLRSEKHLEVFNNYFDEVHQDFIDRLKSSYPFLSPKELRLCAYLKMNLSTKEIAPLMNISVRGVEISRYRLRKKLNLERDTNLTDFILNF
jgi:ligand-binding sensor domain-containing protein/DNA-binding CsgD family transcriptional regulator